MAISHLHQINAGENTYLIEPLLYAAASIATDTENNNQKYYTASISDFELIDGVQISIKIPSDNSGAGIKIGNSNIIPIHYKGSVINNGLLQQNGTYSFIYNNNVWNLIGDITNISIGAGLSGGNIISTGTIKADLISETKLTNAAADSTETSERVYPVRLDKDGKLAVNVPWTDQKVTQSASTADSNIPILLKGTTSPGSVRYPNATNKVVSVNPSTGAITAPGGFIGNASTATNASNDSDGNTINTTYVKKDVIKDLAYISKPSSNNATTYLRGDGTWVELSDMGLSSALRFVGTTTTSLTDNSTTTPIIINNNNYSPTQGDVVLYIDSNNKSGEFLWNGSRWDLLGDASSFKKIQTEVQSSTASGNSTTTFVSSVTQNTEGVITVQTSILDTSGTWSGNAINDEDGNAISTTYLKKSGGTMTGAINRYYNTVDTEPLITVRANNKDAYLFRIGHASSATGDFSNNYALLYEGTGSSPNNCLILKTSNSSTVVDAVQINENGNLTLTGSFTSDIGTSDNASNQRFIIQGNNRKLSLGGGAIQAYGTGTNVATLYLQYSGGTIEVGSENTSTATRNMYGKFNFKSSNGFTYSGMSTDSTDIARPIWFTAASSTTQLTNGLPVYDLDFKYNPSTNALTILEAKLESLTSNQANGNAYSTLTLGNSAKTSTTTAHSEGKIILYSAGSGSYTITGTSTNIDYELILPKVTEDTTGTIALTSSNITGTAANVTGTVAVTHGGTGATTASGARTNLGLGSLATKDGLAWNEITQSGANSLPDGDSDCTASTEILTSYATDNGFSDTKATGKVYRREASKVVNATLVKAALGTGSGTTKFLREDGSWQKPSYPTSFTITANATDGLWDLTGTSGSNSVTYAVGAYNAKQSTAAFYTAATDPSLTTRLNYDGYFYATKLYSGGSEVLTSHYSAIIYTSSSASGKTQVNAITEDPYLNLVENNTVRSTTRLSGSGATTVKSSDDGKTITISSTDTNTLVNYTLGNATRAYLMGSQDAPTSTPTARAAHGDMGVYLTNVAGQLSAESFSINDGTASVSSVEKVWMQWNATDQALEFVFA